MAKIFTKGKEGGISPARKLILGFVGVSTAAIVGTAGFAAAQPDPPNGNGTPAAVAFCKAHFQELGFKNVGQCVAAFQRSQGHGYGNGSNNTVTTNVTNNVGGDNNFVSTAINNVF